MYCRRATSTTKSAISADSPKRPTVANNAWRFTLHLDRCRIAPNKPFAKGALMKLARRDARLSSSDAAEIEQDSGMSTERHQRPGGKSRSSKGLACAAADTASRLAAVRARIRVIFTGNSWRAGCAGFSRLPSLMTHRYNFRVIITKYTSLKPW